MLNNTQTMAGTIGNNSASPRLSPSAISAICCAAKAASHELKVEKIAPAMVVPASAAVFSAGLEMVRPFGRFCMEKREVGLVVGLLWLMSLVVVMLKHLALRTAIVAIVAAIDGGLC